MHNIIYPWIFSLLISGVLQQAFRVEEDPVIFAFLTHFIQDIRECERYVVAWFIWLFIDGDTVGIYVRYVCMYVHMCVRVY